MPPRRAASLLALALTAGCGGATTATPDAARTDAAPSPDASTVGDDAARPDDASAPADASTPPDADAPPDAALPPPDADAPADAALPPDARAAPFVCASLRGAARLLPAFGRLAADETALSMVPDAARGGVVLAPLARPGAFAEDRPMPRGAHDGAGFYLDGWLYMLGGQVRGDTAEASLLSAPVLPDGTLGPWGSRTPFAFGILDHVIRVHAGRAYLTGGGQALGGGNFRQQTRAYVASPSEGDVRAWVDVADNPVRRFGHDAQVAAGFVYTTAGDDGFEATDDVSFAQILADGTLGPWVRTSPVPDGRLQFHAGAATSRHLYVMGGCRRKDCQTVANIERRIYVADLRADGSLGPFRVGGTLPAPNYDLGAFTHAGRLYVTGGRRGGYNRCGDAGGDNYADVWWADLLPDGSLGPWQGGAASGARLPRVRSDHAAVVDHANRLWIYGGRTSCIEGESVSFNGNFPTAVFRADLVADAGLARAGSWLSGALRVASSARGAVVRWEGDGAGLRVRVRSATSASAPWTAWSEATAAREVSVPAGAAFVQVMAEAEGDGRSSPVLRGVEVVCEP